MEALARGTSPEPEEAVPMTPLIIVSVVVILAIIVFFLSARVVRQYERGVVLRFGRLHNVREPGIRFIFRSSTCSSRCRCGS